MINTGNKFATIRINVAHDPEGLPIRKTADVIKELRKDGYSITIIREK